MVYDVIKYVTDDPPVFADLNRIDCHGRVGFIIGVFIHIYRESVVAEVSVVRD